MLRTWIRRVRPSTCSRDASFPPEPRAPLRFISPTEISAFGLNDGYAHRVYNRIYRMFIGDSLRDFTAYWNELLLCGCWGVPHRNALWVPAALIQSAPFIEAFASLIYDYSGQHSSGSRFVEVTSDTLSTADLEAVCSALGAGKPQCRAQAIDGATRRSGLQKLLREELDKPRRFARLNSTNAERFRILERTEVVTLTEPDMLVGDGSWAVDVQVDFASDRFNTPRWWCLPRQSGSILAGAIFRAPARVNRFHLFSVEIERRTAGYAPRKMPELHIALPVESDVVISLLRSRRTGFGHHDTRRQQLQDPVRFSDIRISHPGQNLRGLIERFGSFWTAEEFCERRFWRKAFERLAGQDARKCESQTTTIRNKVAKSLKKIGGIASPAEEADRIARVIMPEVKGALADSPMSYVELTDLLKAISEQQSHTQETTYLSGNAIVHRSDVVPLSEEDLQRGLDRLLARNVLRVGIEVTVPTLRDRLLVSCR